MENARELEMTMSVFEVGDIGEPAKLMKASKLCEFLLLASPPRELINGTILAVMSNRQRRFVIIFRHI